MIIMLITSIATSDESADRILENLEDAYVTSGATTIYKAYSREEAEEAGIFEIRRNYYPASIKIAAEERRYRVNPHFFIKIFFY